MNSAKQGQIIARYESGLLSAAEVANSLLYDLVSERLLDTAFLTSLESLPDEVAQKKGRTPNQIPEKGSEEEETGTGPVHPNRD